MRILYILSILCILYVNSIYFKHSVHFRRVFQAFYAFSLRILRILCVFFMRSVRSLCIFYALFLILLSAYSVPSFCLFCAIFYAFCVRILCLLSVHCVRILIFDGVRLGKILQPGHVKTYPLNSRRQEGALYPIKRVIPATRIFELTEHLTN